MVAVWLIERPIGGVLCAAAAVLMMFSFPIFFSQFPEPVSLYFFLCTGDMISIAAIVLGQSQECFFQSGACNLETRKPGVTSQQFSNHRLGLDGMNLDRLTVFSHFRNARNLAQAGGSEIRDAANPLSAGLLLDLGWRPFGDDCALIDDCDAIRQCIRLFQIVGGQ